MKMTVIHHTDELHGYLFNNRQKGYTIGFVPTMGALHSGHLALLEASSSSADLTVCSIFVNPTQFNDPGDFKKYPDVKEQDMQLLEKTSASVLFLPSVPEIYPSGTDSLEHYELGYLDSILEGQFRPGHFQGVCQVMSRLLGAVDPDMLFMGQKDYQQCMVIKRLLTLIGSPARLVTCPTVREPGGLAMSSRNLRLPAPDREKATLIYQALTQAKTRLKPGSLEPLKISTRELLERNGFRVDYVEIADAATLMPLDEWRGQQALVMLVAAFLGEVRLIDNMLLHN